MFEDYIVNSIIAGVGIAISTGIIGSFVVWKKMAYFGDTLAHSSLLGVVLGLFFGFLPIFGIVFICIFLPFFLIFFKKFEILSMDTLLGVFAHFCLALALIIISFLDIKIDLHAYLFGDILNANFFDIIVVYFVAITVICIVFSYWEDLIMLVIDEKIAKSEGVKIERINFLFLFLIAIVVAVSVKIIGVFLITSMLIIPSASARHIAKSPLSMLFISVLVGVISVVLGVTVSFYLDVITNPSIIFVAGISFFILFLIGIIKKSF